MELSRTLAACAIAAGVGFAVGRATSAKDAGQERVPLRPSPVTKASDASIDRTAFASPEVSAESGEGRNAADHFCRANGFAKAAEFTCASNQGSCRAFDLILCEHKAR